MSKISQYIALGDSMSIDFYPDIDGASRFPGKNFRGLGSASLFYQNNDLAWPNFVGYDLASKSDGSIAFHMLATDGAETQTVIESQLPYLPPNQPDRTLISLSVGGNDLLENLYFKKDQWDTAIRMIKANLLEILKTLNKKYPDCIILINTIYDPTDKTGQLRFNENVSGFLKWLDECNLAIKSVGQKMGCQTIDIHKHFMGHGKNEPDITKRWFWEGSIIEPNVLGAHEIRRLWMDAISEVI